MTIRKHILAAALAGSMMGLAACGGDSKGSQDVGTGGNEGAGSGVASRAFYARAIDGYLAGATVYVDQNENNRLDAFEPRAITDNDGYFSYNHITDTDYCVTGALSQHCLRGNIAAGAEVVIRVTGGYDTVTQLPFEGVLSVRSSDLTRDDLRVVTPVTSMVADSSSESETQRKFQALVDAGIFDAGSSLDDDPMDSNMTRAQMAAMISKLMGDMGEVAYGAPAFQDVQSDAWYHSYIAIAAQLSEAQSVGSGTFGTVFSSSDEMELLVRRVLYAVSNPGQTMPENFELPNGVALTPMIDLTAALVGLNEEMLTALNGAQPSTEQFNAMLRLQALAAERLSGNPADPELTDLFAWVRNQLAQGNRLGTDLTALGGENIDLGVLLQPGFDFDPASNSISASATIPAEAATTFASLLNKSFGLSLDQPDEQGAAVLFVSGDNGARSGDIDVCVRYRGDDEDFDTTSSSDPNGAMLIGGRWSLLDDHTLTLNLEVVGGVRSLLLKAVNGNGADRDYRFDFGGDLSDWSGSAPAAFASGSAPATDAECRAALMDRFGPM